MKTTDLYCIAVSRFYSHCIQIMQYTCICTNDERFGLLRVLHTTEKGTTTTTAPIFWPWQWRWSVECWRRLVFCFLLYIYVHLTKGLCYYASDEKKNFALIFHVSHFRVDLFHLHDFFSSSHVCVCAFVRRIFIGIFIIMSVVYFFFLYSTHISIRIVMIKLFRSNLNNAQKK